jgi:predicted nucleic acid-binding protein
VKLLVDTNVVLDVLLDRSPFSGPATRVFSRVERGDIAGHLGATTITTVHYLAAKAIGKTDADRAVEKLLVLFDVAPVTRTVLQSALSLGFSDYEDAVLHETARHAGLDGIVTRDTTGFRRATLSVYRPDELLQMLAVRPGERP